MRKIVFMAFLVAFILVGCNSKPAIDRYGKKVEQKDRWVRKIEVEETPTEHYQVKFLFEQDGIKVYQFSTGYRYHYFTTRGDTMTTQSNGKTHSEETINGSN